MADYIYLLQNRLTPAQRRAVEAVRDAARGRGMPVFLVGGAVRDLSAGAPVRDLDFAVQGDTGELVQDLLAGGATLAGESPVFAAAYLTFPGGVRTEIGSTLSVTYPKPGQPHTEPAAILDDLRHRDFTANAMAISLNEGSYGLLLDPLNGIADMENRELRLVSNYGFIEQPALLLRAARLTERLGWTLEERTQGRYETAKEEAYIQALPAHDRGYELEEIFHEEDPLGTMEHLAEEGWSEALFPAWNATMADRDGLERVRELMGQLEQVGIHVDPSPVFFPLLTAKLSPEDLAALKALFVRPGFVRQVESLEARGKELTSQLSSKAATTPSETWKMLFAAEPEVVLWLAQNARGGVVPGKLKSFLKEWPQMRQRIPYALMQEMRITPELPGYTQLLEDLFFALIDGQLATPEATRAFLEPYSPPAPVQQASPRRRPAKSARSRSKKVVEEAAPVDAETDEEENDVQPGDRQTDEADDADERAAGDAPGADETAREEDEREADEAPQPEPKPAREVVKAAPGKTKPAAARPAAAAKKSVAAASRPSVADREKAPTSKTAPAAPVASKKAPAKSGGGGSAKAAAPVKTVVKPPAKAARAVAKAASAKAVPVKASAKTPAKRPVPAKAVVVPAKAAAKKAAPPAPAKKAASKAVPTKTPAKKVVPVAGRTSAKAVAPAKKTAAKVAATKSRGR